MHVVRGKNIEVLFSTEDIARRNEELANEIASGPARDLLVIAILKGSFVFAADLIRALHKVGLAPEVEFMTLSSYGTGTVSRGVRLVKDIDSVVEGRDVLLVDDILESGRTLRFARNLMLERGASNVSIAVLLDKQNKREEVLEADYAGFHCPDRFVVGYGMDVAYAFRELPFVGVITGDA
ncbi:hypoxanthine phosphoribosyltransferase [Martelella lutilitoris]|uniref:Hypoxanthine phosphoribosyltransferase n=1 Tax=Martelella lutilitoris TaxID=2583532 RepID=A0A7T7HL28_9HYPH|nr:hypoxanthine phosphoribosyltransferase [Martelella lutilitoris]QQM31064.1 hypoxanthine phosphoribosyltransferase [Martelella lutilitoris]